MLIKVKTLTGKEIEIDIEPTDKKIGSNQNDEKTAADYKVTGGSVLHLVLALRAEFCNYQHLLGEEI
ncbi:hypothetical protein KUTeg_019691 [Tegillarca granosa]|uniref:Uncharacterized protein n=1 Tax=Tegillarca granosa TaxID=220873 RepID=A0ABQ9EIF6_TEGGR|nr:hypothetical protein KUTeg_019691 [Tegillarca granosa]